MSVTECILLLSKLCMEKKTYLWFWYVIYFIMCLKAGFDFLVIKIYYYITLIQNQYFKVWNNDSTEILSFSGNISNVSVKDLKDFTQWYRIRNVCTYHVYLPTGIA